MPIQDDVAKEAAKAVALQLYKDAVQPGALVVGQTIQQFYQTMCVAGLQFGTVSRERIESLFARALVGIPLERRTPPPPQILGPILEGLRYEPEGTPLSEMFENLLRHSMDKATASQAHPAFPSIIKSLNADEARLLRHLATTNLVGPWNAHELRGVQARIKGYDGEPIAVPIGLLDCPEMFDFYQLHLKNLQLVNNITIEHEPDDNNSDWRHELMLIEFGVIFVKACSPAS